MELIDLLDLIIWILIAGFIIAGVMRYLKNTAPERQHKANKAELRQGGIIHDEASMDGDEAARKNFDLMGLPRVDAGQSIVSVPTYSGNESPTPDKQEVVLTTFKVTAYTKSGPDPLEAQELSDGYFVVSTGGKAFLLNRCSLSDEEADLLQQERKNCLDSNGGDQTIDKFMGFSWKIVGAYGTNPTSVGKKCSFLQVISQHPDLGTAGLRSVLPPVLLDGEEHEYFDLRAKQLGADGKPTGQTMLAFYSGQKWNLLIGRQLTDQEVSGLTAI